MRKTETIDQTVNILMARRRRNTRRYIESAHLILVIGSFMRNKIDKLHPGKQYFDVLPSGYNVWTECKNDGITLSIGIDSHILRTYQFNFDLIPRQSRHRCQYLRWTLIDNCGRRVFRIYSFDEKIGSRHELKLTYKSRVIPKAKRRRNWKHDPKLLDPFQPIMSVVKEKPCGIWLSTWMQKVMAARLGGNIYRGVKQEYEESLTVAENEYDTEMNRRRLKYRNLERVNTQRHREKLARQQREAEDEPIIGYRS